MRKSTEQEEKEEETEGEEEEENEGGKRISGGFGGPGKLGRSMLRPYNRLRSRQSQHLTTTRLRSSRWLRELVWRRRRGFRLLRKGGVAVRCRRDGGASRSRHRRRTLRRRCGRWILFCGREG